ncbi:MAG: hypothetical protein NC299_15220 [Lachnospiraceae bacterium]|nr:hypothetical protein [Ruminococcus sp.]MCM1276685.1 hypothetical protein [Lachnospiraceae bacterium]
MANETYQTEEIEQFLIEVTDTEEYKSVEYLVYSIRAQMLDYFRKFKNVDNKFTIPSFIAPLVNKVGELFCAKGILGDNILNYMRKDNPWVMYYDIAFIHEPGIIETIQVDAKFFFLIITGFILDKFRRNYIDIRKMLDGEQFVYKINQ